MAVIDELLDERVPERIGRFGPRGVKRRSPTIQSEAQKAQPERVSQGKFTKNKLSEQYWVKDVKCAGLVEAHSAKWVCTAQHLSLIHI